MFLITIIASLLLLTFIHELGHYVLAKYYTKSRVIMKIGIGKKLLLLKYKNNYFCMRLIPIAGVVFFKDRMLSKKQKIIIGLAGPVFSIIAFIIALYFKNIITHPYYEEVFLILAFCSCLNILPFKGSDGSYVLKQLKKTA